MVHILKGLLGEVSETTFVNPTTLPIHESMKTSMAAARELEKHGLCQVVPREGMEKGLFDILSPAQVQARKSQA